jgi:hypothetical protein
MDLSAVLVQLIAGAAGGNAAGLANKAKSLGPVLNTILGALGGLAGGMWPRRGWTRAPVPRWDCRPWSAPCCPWWWEC